MAKTFRLKGGQIDRKTPLNFSFNGKGSVWFCGRYIGVGFAGQWHASGGAQF